MMRRYRLLAASALVIILSACGSSRPSKYYMLQLPAAPEGGAALPVDLLVGRIFAPQLLRDDRIIYRAGANEVGAYDYHRWAEPPGPMLESVLLHSLRQSGRYRAVHSYRSNARGDVLIRGRLYDFSEVTGSPLVARLKLELEAYDIAAQKPVFARSYSQDEQVSGKEVADVVAALDRATQRAVADFNAGLVEALAKWSPKK